MLADWTSVEINFHRIFHAFIIGRNLKLSKRSEEIKKRLIKEITVIGLLPEELGHESENEDLLTSGLIDSYGFVQFIMFVEREFGLAVNEDLLLDSRVRTISGMTDLIEGTET